jgi:hypothetical protein
MYYTQCTIHTSKWRKKCSVQRCSQLIRLYVYAYSVRGRWVKYERALLVERYRRRRNEVVRDVLSLCHFFPQQISGELTWYWTQISSVAVVSIARSVGIATRYGLDGQGIESRWGENFCTRPERPWGPITLLYNRHRVPVSWVKRPGRGVYHPPKSSGEVKERVDLYLYSPSGPSRLVVTCIGV